MDAAQQLGQQYDDCATNIAAILSSLALTPMTLAQVQVARQQIAQLLQAQAQASQQWVDQNVESTYQQGQQQAVDGLQNYENPITDAVAAAILVSMVTRSQLTTESIQTLKEDISARLTDTLQQMQRSSDYIMNKALHQSIRDRIAGMSDKAAIKQTIRDSLDNMGINGLIDKAGRRWQPDVYAENIANTYLMQARNTALADALSAQGWDLVEISSHGATDACKNWEGRIVSISGNTRGYPTIGDAIGGGLFHNNCKHDMNPVDPADYPERLLAALPTNAN